MSSNRMYQPPSNTGAHSWSTSPPSRYAAPAQLGNQQAQDHDSPPTTPPLVPGNTYSPPISPASMPLASPMSSHAGYGGQIHGWQPEYINDPEAHTGPGDGSIAPGIWCSSPIEQQTPSKHNSYLSGKSVTNNAYPRDAYSQQAYERDQQGAPYRQSPHTPSLSARMAENEVLSDAFHPRRKKALCIGINYIGQVAQLHGCINDVHKIADFLTAQFGYKPENIRKLTDDAIDPQGLPTRENIIAGMRWLVEDAQPTDSLFFHFSGHGGQTKDTDGDEADGFDEVIYPLDFEYKGHIVDDEMHEIMVQPLRAGCRLTAIFDCSHSGSALDLPYTYSTEGKLKEHSQILETGRGLLNVGKYCARGDVSGAIKGLGGVIKPPTSRRARKQATLRSREIRSSEADVISLSACKDSEKSDDAVEGHEAVGAMSHAFIQSLSQKPQQSYRELLNSVREILRSKYSQKPQLSSSHLIDTNNRFIA